MTEKQEIEWRLVTDGLPVGGELVLVYCGYLDDVLFGYVGTVPESDDDVRENGQVWFGEHGGELIVDPVCWAAIPYPVKFRVSP